MPQSWGKNVRPDDFTVVDAAWRALQAQGITDRWALTELVTAALGEGRGKWDNTSNEGLNPDGSVDYGVWNINSVHRPALSRIYDPYYNAELAVKIWQGAGGGRDGFKQWYGHTSKGGEWGDVASRYRDRAADLVAAYFDQATSKKGLTRDEAKAKGIQVLAALSDAIRERARGGSPQVAQLASEDGRDPDEPMAGERIVKGLAQAGGDDDVAETQADLESFLTARRPAVVDGEVNEEGVREAVANLGLGDEVGQRIVDAAKQYLGVDYVWGGVSPNGMDCSGLVLLVMRELGIPMPRVSRDQAQAGREVSLDEAQAGDLIAFDAGGPRGVVNHIGIVVGRGEDGQLMMIHAPRTGDVVRIQAVTRDDILAVRRVGGR